MPPGVPFRGARDPSAPIVRALIVDDDPGVRELLSRILTELGLAVQVAEDGAEAERWLKAAGFDLLFLDLDLPRVSGEQLLYSMQQRLLMRPESVVVMSAAANLAWTSLQSWSELGVANLLPKPFIAGDVRAIVRRLLSIEGGPPGKAVARVLVAGVGLWAQGLSRVVIQGGGDLTEVVVTREIVPVAKSLRPAVIVLGSGQLGDELEPTVRSLHLDPDLVTAAIVVVLTEVNAWTPAELLDAGATRVLSLPDQLSDLAPTVTRLAGLSRRTHQRASLT